MTDNDGYVLCPHCEKPMVLGLAPEADVTEPDTPRVEIGADLYCDNPNCNEPDSGLAPLAQGQDLNLVASDVPRTRGDFRPRSM